MHNRDPGGVESCSFREQLWACSKVLCGKRVASPNKNATPFYRPGNGAVSCLKVQS